MAGVLKKSTGLTGLAVEKNPHVKLNQLYGRILRIINGFPSTYAYRQATEKLIRERANIINSSNDINEVEEKIGCGQIEELIIQARNELSLAQRMQTWKPWEPLVQEPPAHQWTWPPHK